MSYSSGHGGSFAAIVVAAGSGSRYGAPKHALSLRGKPVWQWSVDVFKRCGAAEFVLVGDVPGGVPGGQRRRDSVSAGLEALKSGAPIVLIHDAARPLIHTATVGAVLQAMRDDEVDGAIPAIGVTDTIKRTDGHRITDTVDRSELVAVQTPQAFRTEVLKAAHRRFPDDDATDDASLVEQAGGTVVIVDGDRRNMKITFQGDLAIAELILQGRDE